MDKNSRTVHNVCGLARILGTSSLGLALLPSTYSEETRLFFDVGIKKFTARLEKTRLKMDIEIQNEILDGLHRFLFVKII